MQQTSANELLDNVQQSRKCNSLGIVQETELWPCYHRVILISDIDTNPS